MTTSNSIITKTFEDVLYIPLEAVFSNDSMTFVYKKNKTRQVVVLDEANENEIIVEAGLSKGDKVLLSVPENADDMRFAGLELVQVIREKEAEKKRLEEEAERALSERYQRRRGGAGEQFPSDAQRTWPEGTQRTRPEGAQQTSPEGQRRMPSGSRETSPAGGQETSPSDTSGTGRSKVDPIQ